MEKKLPRIKSCRSDITNKIIAAGSSTFKADFDTKEHFDNLLMQSSKLINPEEDIVTDNSSPPP